MPEFYLFRLRVERPAQGRIFDEPDLPNAEVIRLAIEHQPTTKTRKDTVWALGNVEKIVDDDSYSAALGKILRRDVERYDGDLKAFTQETSEEAPFTWVVFDVALQVCAIAVKYALGNPTQLGNALARLLTSTRPAQNRGMQITASQIKDPEEFVLLLRQADRIVKFEVTFKRPNPIDVDKDFHEPMERLLGETNGRDGKTSISGDNLEKEPLEAISNSAAATGDDAKARLKLPDINKIVTKHLRSNPATISTDDVSTIASLQSVVQKMRSVYRRIRERGES
jgi:hypothetical protein